MAEGGYESLHLLEAELAAGLAGSYVELGGAGMQSIKGGGVGHTSVPGAPEANWGIVRKKLLSMHCLCSLDSSTCMIDHEPRRLLCLKAEYAEEAPSDFTCHERRFVASGISHRGRVGGSAISTRMARMSERGPARMDQALFTVARDSPSFSA
jgi:hypothetical protein